MRVLITGGFGYVGGRFAQFLASDPGYEVFLGSRRQSQPPPWLPRGKTVQTLWDSAASLDQICAGADAVVHLAGMNAEDCAVDPVGALEFNGIATARLVQAAVKQGVTRFIYLSTAHVYGSPLAGVITEETCPRSLHPYAASHHAGEEAVRAAHQRGEIAGIVIRLSNSYGAPAHQDANCWMLLANDLCRQAVSTGRMVLTSSGLQRRDFIPLTDACRAIKHLLELPAGRLGDGLFNAGGAWSPTVMEMTQRIAERVHAATGRRPEIIRGKGQGGERSEPLDYRVQKLVDSGFEMGKNGSVDREIDVLIQFCIKLAS